MGCFLFMDEIHSFFLAYIIKLLIIFFRFIFLKKPIVGKKVSTLLKF